jgi:hypothetical protein
LFKFGKKKILKNSKWPKNLIWKFFCTKIHDFLLAEPLNEIFKSLDMLYFLRCSIVKNVVPVVKVQDGVENDYIFLTLFSKMIVLSIFLFFLFTLGKNETFMEQLFFWKFKMAG